MIPQIFILSARGNLIGGIAFAVGMIYLKYREKEKQRLPRRKKKSSMVLPHQMVGGPSRSLLRLAGLLGAKIFDKPRAP